MANQPLSQMHFTSTERSAVGSIMCAGRHFDLPRVSTDVGITLQVYAVVLVVAGRAAYVNGAGARGILKAGDMMLIFPGVSYHYGQGGHVPAGRWSEWWAHFEGPAFDLWQAQGVITPDRPVIHAGTPNYWMRRLDAVAAQGSSGGHRGEASQLHRVCMFQHVLADAIEHERRQQVTPDDEAWLTRAAELLQPAPGGTRPDWNRIAKQSGMTQEGFRKRFTRLMGVPPARYYTARRLQYACDLLSREDLTLADIAEACGYCDQFQFSRQFQKHIGMAPSQYRRQFRTR